MDSQRHCSQTWTLQDGNHKIRIIIEMYPLVLTSLFHAGNPLGTNTLYGKIIHANYFYCTIDQLAHCLNVGHIKD